jgi:two-component system CheB/CheR fusion protein
MLAVLIDDEPAVLDTLKMLLEMIGFEVLAVASADEALAGLGRIDTSPDIIISDYRLADNQVGTDAIRLIQESAGASIPGIIITGDTSPDRIQEAQESGNLLLHKPIRAKTLKNEIFGLLGDVS